MGGEALRIVGLNLNAEDLGAYTFEPAFGGFFGPHIDFAAGAAATAYAAKKDYRGFGFGGNWAPHKAKNILVAITGRHTDVLLVGGAFGVLGWLVFFASDALALPWDPIAMGVVLSALVHRLVLRSPVIGPVPPFEHGETYETDGTAGSRPNASVSSRGCLGSTSRRTGPSSAWRRRAR